MTKECKRDGCTNERRDIRGSGGLFCSNECRLEYSRSNSGINVRELAENIVRGDE